MNLAVALMFAASYVTIALLNPGNRAPVWFAASYGVGMLTPVAQLGMAYSGWTTPFALLVFFTFVVALAVMVPALAVFYRRRPPWGLVVGIIAYSFAVLPLRSVLPSPSLVRELLYQSPFFMAMVACVWVILRSSPRRASDLVLAGCFSVLALHFVIKAVVAAKIGSGSTPTDYINSTYALISQVSSGILLVAAGLVLLIKALQSVILEKQADAETDPLSGVVNRRGFDLHAERLVEQAAASGWPVSLLLLDLDHFKAVNDVHGHAVGDAAIRAFGALLKRSAPQSAVVGRIGGEEFVVLLDRTGMEGACLQAEALRVATATCAEEGVPPLTVSIGVAEVSPSYDIQAALRDADVALYAAKDEGRNRVSWTPRRAAAAPETL